MPRPKLILLVGLPGSGKSTYAVQHKLPILASDEVRHLLMDDANDQSINRRIFVLLRHMLRMRLELGRPVTCLDATNLTPRERRPYMKIAEMYGADVEAFYFDVPLELCKRRNERRTRVVPEEILDLMAARLRPPTIEEGFARVWVISSKGVAREATQPPETT